MKSRPSAAIPTIRTGATPLRVTFSGPEQDAVRRDFTINGLFYRSDRGKPLDRLCPMARADIQNRLIRTIGNPCARFTRINSACCARFDSLCDPRICDRAETWEAIKQLAPEIVQISHERIRDELTRLFTGPAPDRGPGSAVHKRAHAAYFAGDRSSEGSAQSVEAHPGMDVFEHTRNALARLRKPSLCLRFSLRCCMTWGRPMYIGRRARVLQPACTGRRKDQRGNWPPLENVK